MVKAEMIVSAASLLFSLFVLAFWRIGNRFWVPFFGTNYAIRHEFFFDSLTCECLVHQFHFGLEVACGASIRCQKPLYVLYVPFACSLPVPAYRTIFFNLRRQAQKGREITCLMPKRFRACSIHFSGILIATAEEYIYVIIYASCVAACG